MQLTMPIAAPASFGKHERNDLEDAAVAKSEPRR